MTTTQTDAEKRAELEKLEKELKRQEEISIAGAAVLTPKQSLLQVPASSKNHPKNKDYHLRWVNMRDPQKAQNRKVMGWERVPESEGGATIGDEYALFRIPKQRREAIVAGFEAENKRRLQQHERDLENEAEAVARVLKDKFGIVPQKGILINERER